MYLGWNRLTEKFTCSDFRGPLFCSNLTWAGNPQNLVFSIIYCNIFYNITVITLNYIFSSFKFYFCDNEFRRQNTTIDSLLMLPQTSILSLARWAELLWVTEKSSWQLAVKMESRPIVCSERVMGGDDLQRQRLWRPQTRKGNRVGMKSRMKRPNIHEECALCFHIRRVLIKATNLTGW